MTDGWVHDIAVGVGFERPIELERTPAATTRAELTQFEDSERALVLSVFRRQPIMSGSLGLEAVVGLVRSAHEERAGQVTSVDEGGTEERYIGEFTVEGSDASRVQVVVLRTAPDAAVVAEVIHPLAYDEVDRSIADRIARSFDIERP